MAATTSESSQLGQWLLTGVLLGGMAAGIAYIVTQDRVRGEREGYVADADLPVGRLREAEVGVALVRAARGVVDGGEAAEAWLSELPGRPVVVCGFPVPRPPSCARSEGENLLVALTRAASSLPSGAGAGRISVDVEILDREVSWTNPGHRPRDPGVWGYRAGEAVLPPAQVLTSAVYGGGEEDKSFREDLLRSELQRRHPTPGIDVTTLPLHRFRTVSWVEDGRGGALHTYRLHAFERPSIEPDALAAHAAQAADHLASTVEGNGKVRYLFDTAHGVTGKGYNLLRHGGTTYALLQAYQRFEHEPWLRASEAAIAYLLDHSQRDVRTGPFGGGEVLWVEESSYIKLGGSGLALVMLTQHMQATGSDRYLEEARAYARYLVSQQKQSGEFVYFASRTPGGPPKERDSAYYPGEAILGLAQLYAIDPDPLWLDTARRGADWLIDVRDRGLGPRDLSNDHWLMIGLSHLVKHTGDARYVAHSKALAAAVAYQADRNRKKVAAHPDYFGGYYDPPRSTPAATRGEGLVAVLDTCALVDDPCDDVRALLRDTITHELWAQYTAETVWWVPTPALVVGGFSGGLMDVDLRNDFTQHNLSAVLGAERHLREGVTLPGGPGWSAVQQGPYEPFLGGKLAEHLAPLRGIRGAHRWDPLEVDPGDVDGGP